MNGIVTMGELLVDFLPTGMERGSIEYLPMAGGAPANVAAGVAKLGGFSAFIGKVGDDFFGRFLASALVEAGVDTGRLLLSETHKTSLAFVSLDEQGERSFLFYRDRAADIMYAPEELPLDMIGEALAFHFGSISLIEEPVRSATLAGAAAARERHVMVSYDPNLRLNLWPDGATAKAMIFKGMEFADLLKISEEELVFITGELSVEAAARMVMETGPSLVFVTLGARGCFVRGGDFEFYTDGFQVAPVDTTGAGDAFMAAVLYKIQAAGAADTASLSREFLEETARFANAAGALTTLRKGAMNAMPALYEVEDFIKCEECE
ncbi:MAG: carbohydrate kinase [Spirochaetes bacterium]|nr:MAG: carbohydrate kinase [Spirochaetota bacterium]